jgi:oligogalacturonide lyase
MKGDVFPAEWQELCDVTSGVSVKQLTSDNKGHSHHLYFTNSGWYDDGRKLIFGSDRLGETNLYSLDLQSGKITQLTDNLVGHAHLLTACINPVRPEAYFWLNDDVIALDLKTLEQRIIYHSPPGWLRNMSNCTADGKYFCTTIYENLNERLQSNPNFARSNFEKYWEARPLSRIMKIATDGSSAEAVWEENYWIGHVNTSPTQPNILTFCHEGPWIKVDHRIWGFDLNTGKAWKIRPIEQGDRVGHEYWLADGETVGYHGTISGESVLGFIRYDNTEFQESPLITSSMHFHGNTRELTVGDSTVSQPYILLWRWQDKDIDEPRVLCEHRGSAIVQRIHVHPRFSPNGKQVLFTSDRAGYGNPYLVEVPSYEDLPHFSSLEKR